MSGGTYYFKTHLSTYSTLDTTNPFYYLIYTELSLQILCSATNYLLGLKLDMIQSLILKKDFDSILFKCVITLGTLRG